jgi:hypothetical protein
MVIAGNRRRSTSLALAKPGTWHVVSCVSYDPGTKP